MKGNNSCTSDQRLWENIRNGDMDALRIVYNRFFEALYQYGLKIAGDRVMVEDAIHDLFCELWDRHQRLSTTDNIKFYLFVILKRKILKLKTQKSHFLAQKHSEEWVHESGVELLETLYDPPDIAEFNKKKLELALQKLTKKQKEVVFLRFYGKLKYEEISQLLDINYQSVVNNIFRAMQQLREELRGVPVV